MTGSGNMGNGKHTPTPWRVDPETEGEGVIGADEVLVADCAIFVFEKFGNRTAQINQANAELIVTAVNSYASTQARIAELEGVVREMLDAVDKGSIDSPEIGGEDDIPPHKWHEEWERIARAALASKNENETSSSPQVSPPRS